MWLPLFCFTLPSGKTTKAIFEDYAGELSSEKYKEMIATLKKYFSHLVYALRHPYGIKKKFQSIYALGMAEQDTEQQALNEVMQILEATPDSANPSDLPVSLQNNGKAGSACFHGQIQRGTWHPSYS